MQLAMVRIDDRRIHGQVILGCCEPLGATRLILADDAVAGDEFQTSIYLSGVPSELEAEILAVHATAERLLHLDPHEHATTVVVVDSPASALQLRALLELETIVLGGLHAGPDRDHELRDGYYVGAFDVEAMIELLESGVSITAQPIPGAASFSVSLALLAGTPWS